MLAKFHDIVFYALAENKKTILKSTVRPVDKMTVKRFGVLRGRYTFKYNVYYLADTIHERSRIIKPKYIAWLDEKKKPLRYCKVDNIEAVNTKLHTIDYDGIIYETEI